MAIRAILTGVSAACQRGLATASISTTALNISKNFFTEHATRPLTREDLRSLQGRIQVVSPDTSESDVHAIYGIFLAHAPPSYRQMVLDHVLAQSEEIKRLDIEAWQTVRATKKEILERAMKVIEERDLLWNKVESLWITYDQAKEKEDYASCETILTEIEGHLEILENGLTAFQEAREMFLEHSNPNSFIDEFAAKTSTLSIKKELEEITTPLWDASPYMDSQWKEALHKTLVAPKTAGEETSSLPPTDWRFAFRSKKAPSLVLQDMKASLERDSFLRFDVLLRELSSYALDPHNPSKKVSSLFMEMVQEELTRRCPSLTPEELLRQLHARDFRNKRILLAAIERTLRKLPSR
ncbi:MAG: hypothetical protein JSR76_06075 [Verrucomicrobia bacterium]|nr:hypothetical protein [Verrucomicrobiota bacterium]